MPRSTTASGARSGQARRSSMTWWGVLPLLITVLTGFLLSWHSLSDLDIWFHLRSGRDLLNGYSVTDINRYSYTEPDHQWINHEWMFQILTVMTGPEAPPVANGFSEPDVSGWNLMRSALTLLLLLTIFMGDGGWSRFLGRDGPSAAAWAALPLLVGLMLLWPRLTMRPELFSYFFFVLLIRGTEKSCLLPSAITGWKGFLDPRGPAGRLFLVTVIWAQFHGFASLAPMVILLCAAVAPIQKRWFQGTIPSGSRLNSHPRTAGLVMLAIVALILTPNGLSGLLMPIRAVGQFSQNQVDLRTTISELVPLNESPNSLGLTITIYRVSLIWGILWIVATMGRVSLLRILVFVLAALAAWTNQRSIGFFGVAFMLLHTGAGSHPWRLSLPGNWPSPSALLKSASGLVLTLLLAGLLWPQIIRDDFYLREGVGRRFGDGVTPARYPSATAGTLARLVQPQCFANLDAAGFLLANTSGSVFIDGRTEAYSADLWAEYLKVKRGDEFSLAILAKRRVDAVCLATAGASFDPLAILLLDSVGWKLVAAEGGGLLFQPQGRDTDPAVRGDSDKAVLTRAGIRTLAAAERGSPTRKADFCLAAGHLFMFAGDDEQRESAYLRGLSFKPDHPTLNHNLGNLLLARQDFQEALPHFQVAVDKNPRLAGSALNLGVCQMRLGRLDEAIRSFRRAAAVDPARFAAWVNLSSALFRSGDRPGAIKALERALEIRPAEPRLRQQLNKWKGGTRKVPGPARSG